MHTENFLRQIRNLIAADELEAALLQLRALLENSPKLDEAILQSARFQDIRKQIRKGTVSYAEASLTKNQIQAGLLDLLREMDEGELMDVIRFNTDRNHKVPRLLTEKPPIDKNNFVGREKEMRAIYRRFFPKEQRFWVRLFQGMYDVIRGKRRKAASGKLLILSGEGGIGKTTLAAHFFHLYEKKYRYMAWVVHERNQSKALSELAKNFQIHFSPEIPDQENLPVLFKKLGNLKPVVLLVLDNADDLDALRNWYAHLLTLSNFHILVTSRITKLSDADLIAVEGLSKDNIVSLFDKHYPLSQEERQILNHIRKAVDDNTLVLELMAKNLAELNKFAKKYTLSNLLADLNSKGLLAVRQSFIEVLYRGKLHKAKPDDIIAFMYDLDVLTKEERVLLSWFSLLPVAEKVSHEALELLFEQSPGMDEHLNALTQKGWLRYLPDDRVFQCSPVIREMMLRKNDTLREDSGPLVEALLKQLDENIIHQENYKYSSLFCRYAESVVQILKYPDLPLTKLYGRIGNFYTETGDIENALYYFQEYKSSAEQLCLLETEEPYYKNELGLSCRRLGETYKSSGDLGEALTFFEQYNQQEKELYETYPQNDDFKNNLAIAYQRLGETHSALGNLDRALTFFERDNQIKKELYISHPQNDDFKNGLAVAVFWLGVTHTRLGDLYQALAFYERYNQLEKELYEAYPQNVKYKKNLSISYERLGITYASLGNLDSALTFFGLYNQFGKELYETYPQNVDLKNSLAISYERLGSTQSALGNLESALTFFDLYNKLGKELYEVYPQNVDLKNNLAVSYERLGSIHTSLSNLGTALAFFEQRLALTKELYDAYPQNVDFKDGLAVSYQHIGNTHYALGDFDRALTFFEDFATLMKELCEAHQQHVNFKNGFATSYEKLGDTHQALGNLDRALTFFEQYNQLEKELYEDYPQNVDFKSGLAYSCAKLGLFYQNHRNELATAKTYFQQCHTLWKELSEAYPAYVEFTTNFNWAKDVLGLDYE